MSPPLLSIVVVSFNTREHLRLCLGSLASSAHHQIVGTGVTAPGSALPCQVIVVDNDSGDGSAEMVEAEYPLVHLVRMGENAGFARATNAGLRQSQGQLLLLLNPDTEVLGDALPTLAGFLATHDRVGAVGPALVYPDGRPQSGAFRFPSLGMSFLDFFPINHRLGSSGLNGRYRLPKDGSPFPVDHPLGAALMMKRQALAEVGLLDEAFFMYCEEVDWCLRARQRGWEIYQVPAARIVHHVGQSTGQRREEMLVELHRSRYYLFRKHYSPGFIRAHRAITRLGLAREMVRTRWLAWRGKIGQEQLERRLWAYRAIWNM